MPLIAQLFTKWVQHCYIHSSAYRDIHFNFCIFSFHSFDPIPQQRRLDFAKRNHFITILNERTIKPKKEEEIKMHCTLGSRHTSARREGGGKQRCDNEYLISVMSWALVLQFPNRFLCLHLAYDSMIECDF